LGKPKNFSYLIINNRDRIFDVARFCLYSIIRIKSHLHVLHDFSRDRDRAFCLDALSLYNFKKISAASLKDWKNFCKNCYKRKVIVKNK